MGETRGTKTWSVLEKLPAKTSGLLQVLGYSYNKVFWMLCSWRNFSKVFWYGRYEDTKWQWPYVGANIQGFWVVLTLSPGRALQFRFNFSGIFWTYFNLLVSGEFDGVTLLGKDDKVVAPWQSTWIYYYLRIILSANFWYDRFLPRFYFIFSFGACGE